MSLSDLTSIPLPVEPSSAGTIKNLEAAKNHKTTARGMLRESLKNHKGSSSKELTALSRHSPVIQETHEASKIKTPATGETAETSQSIVDELFKDFIARKFNHASRETTESRDESTMSRVRTSADEISKILDLEINSIRSHTQSKDITKQQEKLLGRIDHKPNSSSRKSSKFDAVISSGKRKLREDVLPHDSVRDTSMQFETPVNSQNPDSVSSRENIAKTLKYQPLINDSQPVLALPGVSICDLSEKTITAPSTSAHLRDIPQQVDTAHLRDAPQQVDTTRLRDAPQQVDTAHLRDAPQQVDTAHLRDAPQQVDTAHLRDAPQQVDTAHLRETIQLKDTAQSSNAPQLADNEQTQANDNNVIFKRNVMLPMPLAKKMVPPRVLGVKLSTQSLSLITSTDRIDREGRVWEEGEVQSSHSEGSEKDVGGSESEHKGFPSDSGSVNSNTEDWRTQISKHKKKHKYKHKKKKKKKSTREKSDSADKKRSRESKDRDKEKSTGRGKDVDENDKDRHRSHSRDDRQNSENREAKVDSNADGKEKQLEAHNSKGEREKSSKEKERAIDNELEASRKKDQEDGTKRKISRSRSRSPKRHKRSRSSSRSRSPKRKGSWSSAGSSRYSEWDARRYSDDFNKFSGKDSSRSRSRSKEPSSDRRRRSRDSSRSRQSDHGKEGSDRDLRLQIDKAKLRKIAIANALQNMKAGQGPQVDLTLVKSGGKSVEELTEFCKRISEKGKSKASNDVCSSSEEDVAKQSEDEELLIHHPFKMKEASASGIVLNIRNAKQLPVLTPSEKQAQQATLRLTFPVSSGSHHRASESEWVPVVKTPAVPAPAPIINSPQVTGQAPPPIIEKKVDSIFPHPSETRQIDIGSIISERLQAVRKLQENPFDMQALSKMHEVQEQASKWATSKHLPGQFTGSTGAQVMSQEELIGNRKHQAWAKKTQLSNAAPVNGGIGMFLLQKMGWKQGEGLGKNNEGNREPLMLDIKIDRKGLTTSAEHHRHKAPAAAAARAKDLSNKHPVSALMELCNRRRWGPPLFTVVSENGPDHKKSFLFKVQVNNTEYQPAMASSNKKTAKAQCAAICLQEMGLIPRDAPLNI